MTTRPTDGNIPATELNSFPVQPLDKRVFLEMIQEITPDGALLILGGQANPDWEALCEDAGLSAQNVRQLCFWEASPQQPQSAAPSAETASNIHIHRSWAANARQIPWSSLGHFDSIWVQPDALAHLSLPQLTGFYQTLAERAHLVTLTINTAQLDGWLVQGRPKRQDMKAARKAFQENQNPAEGNTVRSVRYYQLARFATAHLPGIFWGHRMAEETVLLGTTRHHTPAEFEQWHQRFQQQLQLEHGLQVWQTQWEKQQKREDALNKATALAGLFPRHPAHST